MLSQLLPLLWTAALAAAFPGVPDLWGAPQSVPGPAATPQSVPDLPVRELTLQNGLRVLVLPRPGAPIASFVIHFPLGSVNEAPGSTGISHLLEHLLFKGTTTVGTRFYEGERPLLREMDALHDSILRAGEAPSPDTARIAGLRARIRELEDKAAAYVARNELEEIYSRSGARGLNAVTTVESTAYFVEIPSNRAELWFVLEADRFRNPVFREFYTERDVVAEERRLRMEDNPGSLLYEAHLAAAFQIHPYGAPVIGHMEDIERLSRPEVETHFRRFYGPNNGVVAIVGDVDPHQILRWAEEYLGSIPPGEEPPPVRTREPEQRGERRVEVEHDAEPILRVGWRVPSSRHEDAPALRVLAYLLTGGRSSRIHRRLVQEDRIASTVTSAVEPGQLHPGLFVVEAYPLAPASTRDLEAAIYEELERLKESPPEDSELQRIRNQLEASEVRRLRSNFGLAFQMAESESLYGDWRATFDWPRRLQEVTPEDVQRVVKLYFHRRNRTVATLVKPGEGLTP